MSPNGIIYNQKEQPPRLPEEAQTPAIKLEALRRQFDSLFGDSTNLRDFFYEKLLPLIREAEERKIG